MSDPMVFVNCFEVAANREDDFVAGWHEVNAYMARQPGYLDHRLHRAATDQARFRYVNVAHWTSADDWRAAHGDEFRSLRDRLGLADFPSTPALYSVVDAS